MFSVCMPLRSRVLVTRKRTHIAIIVLCILPALYNLPFWYEILKNGKVSVKYCESWTFYWLYSITPTLAFFHVVPLILLIGINIKIWTSIREGNRNRTRDFNVLFAIDLTKITFTIVVFSLISNLLPVRRNDLLLYSMELMVKYFQVVWQTSGSHWFFKETFSGYIGVFMLLVWVINSSVNFIIYCGLGKKFREEMRAIFRCK